MHHVASVWHSHKHIFICIENCLDGHCLDIDCDHVFQFDQMLYRQIEDYPADIIPIFDLVVTQVYKELDMYNIGGPGGAGDQDPDYNMNNDDYNNDHLI